MSRAVLLLPLLGILCILSLSAQEIPAPAETPSLAPDRAHGGRGVPPFPGRLLGRSTR